MFNLKYRPGTFSEFVGNETSIQGLLSKYPDWPHTFLIVGPPGIGKTTLARLIAKQLKCEEINTIEVNAAQDRGIDNVREIIKSAYNRPLIGSVKLYIFDECQGLTKDAQDALLKITEEPPKDVYFVFCSTDPQKISKALKSRCQSGLISLQPLSNKELGEIIKHISEAEEIPLTGEIKEIAISCIKNADGIPRSAVMLFNKFYKYSSSETVKKEIAGIDLEVPEEFWPMINALDKGDFRTFVTSFNERKEKNFEGFRIVLGHIFKKKLLKALESQPDKIVHYSKVVKTFSKPVDNTLGDIELSYRFSKWFIS